MTPASEFREFARITQARLILLIYRSVIQRNIAIQAAVLERPREVCPSVLHEKPTSPSSRSTRQALRGNDGISRARAESNIAECAIERVPPFYLCPLPPSPLNKYSASVSGWTHKQNFGLVTSTTALLKSSRSSGVSIATSRPTRLELFLPSPGAFPLRLRSTVAVSGTRFVCSPVLSAGDVLIWS